MATPASADELQRIVNHVFLPPKLPQQADDSTELALINITLQALTSLQELLSPHSRSAALDNAVTLVANTKASNSLPGGKIDEPGLQRTLTSLPVGRTLAVTVSAQNAAVLITRRPTELVFEEFELSPQNEAVITTKGRLIRTFPGLAVAVSASLLDQDDFPSMIASTLSTMAHQEAPDMQPRSRKARATHEEHRDTTHPAMVSELFFGVLRGFGAPTTVSAVIKNTRDEVLYHQAKAPWRRSPMWLLLRVALQIVITRSPDGSHQLYKEMMVYIMSHILQSAHKLPTDMIYVSLAKIQRRLQKLSHAGTPVLPPSVMATIDNVLQQASKSISTRWAATQRHDSRDLQLSTLATLDFEKDTLVALPALDEYLNVTLSRKRGYSSSRFEPTSQLIKYSADAFPRLPGSNSNDPYYATANLSQLEQWVAQHIDSWVVNNKGQDIAVGKAHDLMTKYFGLANSHYRGNPEAISVMVLTIFELWIACDKVALSICPLLGEFDPGITSTVLQSLLLPFLDQMQRLSQVEEYLDSRRIGRTQPRQPTELLFDTQKSKSFASQFFDKSHSHQALLSKIESDATAARQAKLDEFRRVKAEYRRLDALYIGAAHDYITKVIDTWCDPPETEEVHSQRCKKCIYEKQRNDLQIKVHEWPLPSAESEVKAVVFELQAPSWFVHWRDARLDLLSDVLQGERAPVRAATMYLLSSNDPHLSRAHFERSVPRRIDLLSDTKPMSVTHYSSKNVTTLSEHEICARNSLQYRYYDTRRDAYLGQLTFKDQVAKACTYTLPCPALQPFIFRPASAPDGPGPNLCVASQDACPHHMTLAEFKELASLPLGHRIQWANILLQLAMPGVDLKKPETSLVVLQCVYQAGPRSPSSSILRDSHDMLNSEQKASSLLQHLAEALQRVKENWESAQALRIFVAIAARALSLSSSVTVQSSCLAFLTTARSVAMGWVLDLRAKAIAAVNSADRTTFVSKSVEAALLCTSTYDVDHHHLAGILTERKNASILFQSSIVVQEGEHSQPRDREQNIALLDLRFKRLLHRSYTLLAQCSAALDDAVAKSWHAYVSGGSGWNSVSEAADHWLTTDTAAVQGACMTVHYNLLSGELLVNGLPLDQPPKSYRSHSLYSTLFGMTTVEVMPSTTPGFQFSAKNTFGAGYAVQLGVQGGDLIIQAAKDSCTYETVPGRLVEVGFPIGFAVNYVHWFDATTHTIQFRSKDEPWNAFSPATWTLSKQHGQGNWRLTKAGCSVAGMETSTSQRVCRVLDPLAHPNRIHNILQPSGDTLHVNIPALRLGFTITQGGSLLESKEFRSMIVDPEQILGTFVGLRNKIVLMPLEGANRLVLIPESTSIGYARKEDHIAVTIRKESIVKVHAVYVDSLLGRLLDNGDLGCKLYLAYLHALTSSCLVDPLTQKTGTEQALTILNSAAVHSFDQLSQAHIDMLVKIANLSPGRRYYPRHERVMQTVDWDDQMSFLSQHGHIVAAAKALLHQAIKAEIFFPESQLSYSGSDKINDKIDEHLLTRDNVRSTTFRVPGFGAEDHDLRVDQRYAARDCDGLSQRATRASVMSTLFSRDDIGLSESALAAGRLWQIMRGVDPIHGPRTAIVAQTLTYDSGLFKDGYNYVIQRLPAIQRWLSSPATSQQHKFSVVMWLSTMASAPKSDMPVLQAIAIFFKSTALAHNILRNLVGQHRRPFHACPEVNLTRQPNEKRKRYDNRCQREWQQASDSAIASLVIALDAEWPCDSLDTRGDKWSTDQSFDTWSTYIDLDDTMQAAKLKFKRWNENILLEQYLASVERAVSGLPVQSVNVPMLTVSIPSAKPSVSGYFTEHSIFLRPAPELPATSHSLELPTQQQSTGRLSQSLLGPVVKTLENLARESKYERQYVADLSESLDALLARGDRRPPSVNLTHDALLLHLDLCSAHASKIYDLLVAALLPLPSSLGARAASLWPRVSPTLFLQQLARHRWDHLPERWKRCIVEYGLALTELQRAQRLVTLSDPSRKEDLINELHNSGHQSWDPMQYPESLLMEVESGVIIREVQEQVAAQMRSPPAGNNAVSQLNMGEGKSSVIVPIVAAALANGHQLVRVLVAKPQSKQMAQMLISKLGGLLLDRRIYYMPISRSLKLNKAGASSILGMVDECMSKGGILLVHPEHMLSLQLMVQECYISGKDDVGQELMRVQTLFERYARDIVDESDENFSVRFELVYTMGMQGPIELTPSRWHLVQQVLEFVRLLVPAIATELPGSLDYHPGVRGSFPRVRILRPEAEALLIQRLAEKICDHGLDELQIARQPEEIRKAVLTYITEFELSTAESSTVESSLFWTDTTSGPLLLVRGLLGCGVLSFVLRKRWRVDHGLATRTPPTRIAVPYNAKDSPSPRSEFSHPDVVITLTSLTYYYGGLSDDDLFTTMGHLLDADQSDIEYQAWVRDAHDLPVAFRQLQGINLKDRPQCISDVFPALRYAKSVVDYYLSHIVFAKEMKEFPHKLSASGWDLGKRKKLPVTGFSGTNDSRCVLPIHVQHLDTAEQRHTNALVLENILKPENGVVLMSPIQPNISDAQHLLDTIHHLVGAQVLLDVGAQVLELNNLEVAKTWLNMSGTTKQAAVFVNDDHDLCVVDRNNRVDLLRTSSFATRLDSCLIFLDEAHTRGIDLRLPTDYRAAVTLGANLNKDKLVQACMRMRKLGKGQTVVFCVLPEIQAKISERVSKESADIDVADVLVWSISETCAEARRSMPLFAVQGERFVRQEQLWKELHEDGQMSLWKEHAGRFLEAEAQTLEDRYRPRETQSQPFHLTNASDPSLRCIAERCRQFDNLRFDSSTLQEEQERELSPEIEQERQVQRPPPAEAKLHSLHPDVRTFATTGVYNPCSKAYMPAFEALRDCSAAEGFPIAQLAGGRKLFVTADFVNTINLSGGLSCPPDTFQRPVQWLLTSRVLDSNTIDRIIIISPYEANQLYRSMEVSTVATLHVYKPRCNSGYASLDQLDLHTIPARAAPPIVPRVLAMQLNLFAGQLYIGSYGEYQEICRFLGLSTETLTKEMSAQGWKVGADGFILSDGEGRIGGKSGVKQSPVNFLKVLMSQVRRNGDGIAKTHMGGLLEGKLFQESDFED